MPPVDPGNPQPPFRGLTWTEHEHLDERPDVRVLLVRRELLLRTIFLTDAVRESLTVDLVLRSHRLLFEPVWPEYAGAVRGFGTGEWPYAAEIGSAGWGSPPADVRRDLDMVIAQAWRSIQSLDAHQQHIAPDALQQAVFRVAAWVHCALNAIHPFVNGNGRTTRIIGNWVLIRYGFDYLDWNRAPRADYLRAFRVYLRQQEVDAMDRFFQRLHWLATNHLVELHDGLIVPEAECSPADARAREKSAQADS